MSNDKFTPADTAAKKLLSRVEIIVFAIMTAVTFLILASTFMTGRLALTAGDIAPNNVYYFGSSTSFVSQIYTEQAQQLAAAEVEQLYKYDDQALANMQVQIDTLFDSLHVVRVSAEADEAKQTALATILTPADSDTAPADTVLTYYLGLGDDDEAGLRNAVKNAVVTAYGRGEFADDEVPDVVADCRKVIRNNYSGNTERFLLAAVDMLSFKPTYVFDRVATMDAVSQAMSSVQPVTVSVYPGQQLIKRGAEVTEADIETLEALNLQRSGGVMQPYTGLLLFIFICYGLLLAYCTSMGGDSKINAGSITLISVLFIVILLIARVITLIKFDSSLTSDWMLGLSIPVPAFSMLVAALVNKRTAIFSTVIVSVFVGIMCGVHMMYACAALIGGLVAVLQINRMNSRSYYAMAVVNIAATYLLVAVSWCFMWSYERSSFYVAMLMSLINGVLSVILTVGTMPLLESAFSITTGIRLMELSNINHPLLKKLMIEAPGTYNHSIIVGNLAEAAADRIGANGLLVRVAAYFHDIGKIKRPNFFVENQKPGENPHDKLQPSLSTFIITSHTKEGAEMARAYKLPKEIIDIIEQHHGTSLVQGFYQKALAAQENSDVDIVIREEDFCYPGPKPQTREAALVMLADSCQAAVQSMTAPTSGQIEGMVRDIVKGKLNSGQLDQCALTFRDLDIISSTYATILAGANHYRLPYPEQLAKELAKLKNQEEKAEAKAAAEAAENKAEDKTDGKDGKDSKDNKDKENNKENNREKSKDK